MQGSISGIKGGYVEKLMLQQAGTFNQMYNRPFELQLQNDNVNVLARCIAEQSNVLGNGAMVINNNALTPLLTNIFKPVAHHDGIAPIVHGWDSPRCRFILIIVMQHVAGYDEKYFVTGSTDHVGITNNSAIDHRMTFQINSVIKSKAIIRNTPNGIINTHQINENSHMVHNYNYEAYTGTNIYTMRPADIFSNIAMQSYESESLTGIGLNNIVTDAGSKVNRDHYVGSRYVGSIINSWNDATNSADGNTSFDSVCSNASKSPACINPTINRDDFLRMIRNSSGSYAKFTFRDLLKFDSSAESKISYTPLNQTMLSTLPRTGEYEYMHGTNMETVIATEIAQALPAIATSVGLSHISLFSTNDTPGQMTNTLVSNPYSLASNVGLQHAAEAFKIRFNAEVAPSISLNNSYPYVINVDCDTLGSTKIRISFNNQPEVQFMIPSFADSAFSGLITHNVERPKTMANDLTYLFNELGRVAHEAKPQDHIQVAQTGLGSINTHFNAEAI